MSMPVSKNRLLASATRAIAAMRASARALIDGVQRNAIIYTELDWQRMAEQVSRVWC